MRIVFFPSLIWVVYVSIGVSSGTIFEIDQSPIESEFVVLVEKRFPKESVVVIEAVPDVAIETMIG